MKTASARIAKETKSTVATDDILAVRRFNRFYTQAIGVLKRGLLDSEYSLTEVRVLYELAHAHERARGFVVQPFDELRVNGAQHERESGELTAASLCAMLDLDPSYCSRIVRGFEAKGWVARVPSSTDGRAMALKLTAAGRRAFSPLERASNDEAKAMLAKLVPNDRANVLASMRQIESVLSDAHGSTSSPRADREDSNRAVSSSAQKAQGERKSPATSSEGVHRIPARGEPVEPRSPAHKGNATDKPVYRLRPHRPGDMGWVISRHAALYAQEYGWDITFEALVAEICAKFVKEFDPSRERCWIAEDDAGPLGCAFVVKKSKTTAKLRMLLVEPRARGMKLGARLVDEAIAFAREGGYTKMTLWTNDVLHAARHIYVVRGFKLAKEEKHHSFGKDLVGQYWDLKLP